MEILAIGQVAVFGLLLLGQALATAFGAWVAGREGRKTAEGQATAAKTMTTEATAQAERARYGEKIRLALAMNEAPGQALEQSMTQRAELSQQNYLRSLAHPTVQASMMSLYGQGAGQTFDQGIGQVANRADAGSILRDSGYSPEAFAAFRPPLTPAPGMEAA